VLVVVGVVEEQQEQQLVQLKQSHTQQRQRAWADVMRESAVCCLKYQV
jgi:hypothetical protein